MLGKRPSPLESVGGQLEKMAQPCSHTHEKAGCQTNHDSIVGMTYTASGLLYSRSVRGDRVTRYGLRDGAQIPPLEFQERLIKYLEIELPPRMGHRYCRSSQKVSDWRSRPMEGGRRAGRASDGDEKEGAGRGASRHADQHTVSVPRMALR